MSLVVTRAKVKEMCGIADTTYDSEIDNLIADLVPVVEYAIKPEHIEDTGSAGLVATLDLGAAEVVAGEFLAQLARFAGAADTIQIGDLFVTPIFGNVADPYGLKDQGWLRLRPYLRIDPGLLARAPTTASPGKRGQREDS